MAKPIDYNSMVSMLKAGAMLIDVREQDELTEGGIPGDTNWPLSSFGIRRPEISQKVPTIFYCRSGMRSMQAAEIATTWTAQQVFFLHGGYLNYSEILPTLEKNHPKIEPECNS